MSIAVHNICILRSEGRKDTKRYVVYEIQVEASVRSWILWRRYSEFDELHTELVKVTGSSPPIPLPSKHRYSILRSVNDEKLLEERKEGLEAYLRAIISSRDSRWRDTYAFKQFLRMPSTATGGLNDTDDGHYTLSSWLEELSNVRSLTREVRAVMNKRDELLGNGDMTAAHSSNAQARKKLAFIITSVEGLTKGLEMLHTAGLSDAEAHRRTNMLLQLQEDCENITKMLTVNSITSIRPIETKDERLLDVGAMPYKRVAKIRILGAGAAPIETNETRPLDNQGLLQLQQQQMDRQDAQLSQLSNILQRQKQIAVAVGAEIAQQNELLDDLSNDVDNVNAKLGRARRQMDRLS